MTTHITIHFVQTTTLITTTYITTLITTHIATRTIHHITLWTHQTIPPCLIIISDVMFRLQSLRFWYLTCLCTTHCHWAHSGCWPEPNMPWVRRMQQSLLIFRNHFWQGVNDHKKHHYHSSCSGVKQEQREINSVWGVVWIWCEWVFWKGERLKERGSTGMSVLVVKMLFLTGTAHGCPISYERERTVRGN